LASLPSWTPQYWTTDLRAAPTAAGWEFSLPLWLPLTVFLVLTRRAWFGWLRRVIAAAGERAPARPESPAGYQPSGFCPKCGYAMDPGRCPECGRDVSPAALRRGPRWRPVRRFAVWAAKRAVVVVLLTIVGALAWRVAWVELLPADLLLRLQDDQMHWTSHELLRRYRLGQLDANQCTRLFRKRCDAN